MLWNGKVPLSKHLYLFNYLLDAQVPDASEDRLDRKLEEATPQEYGSTSNESKVYPHDPGKSMMSLDELEDEDASIVQERASRRHLHKSHHQMGASSKFEEY